MMINFVMCQGAHQRANFYAYTNKITYSRELDRLEIGPKSQVFEKQRMVNSLKLLKDEEWNHWKEFSSRAKITRNFKLLSLQEF